MDRIKDRLMELVAKYRYFVVVLLFGVLLMLLPGRKATNAPEVVPNTEKDSIEQRMCEILQRIDGVGKVEVMLTEKTGAETLYQNDLTGNESGSRSDTVILTDASRSQSGLIRQVNPPVYQGAIIVCQGGDRVDVKLSVMDAVSKITGLKFSQISVLKMK